MPRLTINRREIEAGEGTTVLEAARQSGIDIPTLCYHRALAPQGACRLCIVEVEGPGLPRTVAASCNLKISEGMIVETHTPLILDMRKTILELIFPALVSNPAFTAATMMNERERLRALRAGHESNCALCGRCIGVCRDHIGAAALSFRTTGENRKKVIEYVGFSREDCIGCGACAQVCPIGAIRVEDMGFERRIFRFGKEVNRVRLIGCEVCGTPMTTERFIDSIWLRIVEQAVGQPGARTRNLCPECARNYYAASMAEGIPAGA